jgi:AhpD family alkylhydroperoxidase
MDVQAIAWNDCLVPAVTPSESLQAEITAILRIKTRSAWINYLAPAPWLARAKARLNLDNLPIAFISVELADLIALVVSRENSCRFCYGITRAFLRVMGRRDEEIERLERGLEVESFSARDKLALELTRKLARANPRVGASDWRALLDAGFSRDELGEITAVASALCWLNRVSTLLALPPPSPMEEPVQSWPQEFFGWWSTRLRSRARRPPAAPPSGPGFGSVLFTALGNTPLAGAIHQCVEEALASPILPLRTKLLTLGVSARALGCTTCERNASQALEALGVSGPETNQILTYLGAPGIDEREARLLAFARDAAFVSPAAAIQRQAQEVARHFSSVEMLEVVGIVALGNLLGRLSTFLEF